MATTVLSTRKLSKTYLVGLRRRVVHALQDLDLDVNEGEIFGFLGPNGAGKSTTIKLLTGLAFPTAGEAFLYGQSVQTPAARARIGYLPENPYFHDFLTPTQLLRLAGQLCGVSASQIAERTPKLLELVGLDKAHDLPLRRFSKGMVQRAGIAQALINDPDLVILDEPMSGLDPIGRKEVRDVIFRLKEEGKTVFFSSHILPDVEAICDRVALVLGGRLRECGTLDDLLSARTDAVDLIAERIPDALDERLRGAAERILPKGNGLALTFASEAAADEAIAALAQSGARIVSVTRHRESLEDLFMRKAHESGAARPLGSQGGPTRAAG